MVIKPKPTIFRHEQGQLILWGGFSFFTYIALAYYSSLSSQINITFFLGIITFAFVGYGGIVLYYFRKHVQPSLYLIICFAIAFHVVGIIANPQFEDDYFRYLWDGYTFFELGNPYINAPSDYFSDEAIPANYQALLNQINYPEVKTIYGPLLQYSFWLSHYFFPADITGLKILYSLCNIGIIIILSKMVDARYVLLYAWNPLLIKEIAYTAHPDVIGVVFLMAAIYYIGTRPKHSAALLGVSVCSKPFAWLIAIYLLLRFSFTQWLIFLFVIALLYLPFTLDGNLFAGLSAFGNDWEFNAAIYSIFTLFLSPFIAKALAGIVLLGILLYYYTRYRDKKSQDIRGDIIIGSLLILSPVINPWYLVWLLPFAALHFQIWPWVTSFAILLSYFSGINMFSETLQAYELAAWVKPMEYSLIFFAVAYDLIVRKKINNRTAENQ